MTDPFSISAGVVGVVSLGLTVSQGFLSFYRPWTTFDEEIQHFSGKLEGLQNIPSVLEGFILNEDEFDLASDQYEKLLDKCKSTDCSLFVKKHDWLRLRRAAYPFKKETLVTLSQTVSGLQDNLNLALQLMNGVLINQQQKQLQDIISHTTSIDTRTTTILDVVKQDKTTVHSSLPAIGQEMIARRQLHDQPMLDPSMLRSFCNRQALINTGWKRQSRRLRGDVTDTISRYCTCSRRPFNSSSFSFFALHESDCPLYEAGQHTFGVAAKYNFCNRLLGLSVSVMMTMTRGAGAFSINPTIRFQGIVDDNSPAFTLVNEAIGIGWINASETLTTTRDDLLALFREKAAPTDRLADGSTILHHIAEMLFGSHWASSPSLHDIQAVHGLVLAMIEAGVPANERTVQGMTVFDRFMQAASFYVHRLQNDSRSIGLHMLQGLLTSGSYMRSLMLSLKRQHRVSRASSAEDRWYRYDDLVRIVVHNRPASEQSIEALRSCLLLEQSRYTADLGASDFETLMLMCLDWTPGMLLLLKSTLPRSTEAVGNCFRGACQYREFASALLLLEYIDKLETSHLEAAARCGDISVLKQILQELALQQLPVNTIRSLGLPTEGLLDTKAYSVILALKQQNIKVKPGLYASQRSVYSAVLFGGTTAADLLYASGFTDMNQHDSTDSPPLVHLFYYQELGYPYILGQVLDLARWMIDKGADLHQHLRGGYPVIFALAEEFGRCFDQTFSDSITNGVRLINNCEVEMIFLSLHVDSTRLLQTILSDNTIDDCLCACSDGGCSALSRFLSRVPMPISVHVQEILRRKFPEQTRRASVSATLRYLTFDLLGITHTCHRKQRIRIFDSTRMWLNDQFDPEDAQEIHEEESYFLDQLEHLVAEFDAKYDELGVTLSEFYEGYWKTRMREVLVSGGFDEVAYWRASNIGIILDRLSEEEPGEDFEFRIRS
ncbi:hypothetical protein BJY01DRAFT_237329 [Aspergillus pseudoustus]|uniref:Fungal N-terminal domain-containing protein n=1 Tax=Aspergillus pseudoustus TaxID=1810923 RepID=A0ABR4JFJ4_9EURO